MAVRIVVVDDHAVVREGLRMLLSSVAGFELVGFAASAHDAVRAAVTLRPDLIIMDIRLEGSETGIEATSQILRAVPTTAILMLTMLGDDESIFAAMRAGALGYVLKSADPDNIIRAVSAVAAGEAIFSPGVARRALGHLVAPADEPALPELSAREREVLQLIAAGLLNAEIARQLHVATNTVSNHISRIFAKLQVANRPEAILRAIDAGLG